MVKWPGLKGNQRQAKSQVVQAEAQVAQANSQLLQAQAQLAQAQVKTQLDVEQVRAAGRKKQ